MLNFPASRDIGRWQPWMPLLESPGFGVPSVTYPREFDFSSAPDREQLASMGIKVSPPPPGCTNNRLIIAADAKLPNTLRVEYSGNEHRDNLFVIGPSSGLQGLITIAGSGNTLLDCGNSRKVRVIIRLVGNAHLFYWGRSSTSNDSTFILQGEQTAVIVGEDCMFSMEVWFRTSDMHALIDLSQMAMVNEPEAIVVGPHVWVGQQAFVLKGATIGHGSVIAARSLVSGEIPARSLAVGAPARVVRQNISWTRRPKPSPQDIEALMQKLLGFDRR